MYRQASVLNRSGKNYLCTCLAEFLQSVDKVIKLLRIQKLHLYEHRILSCHTIALYDILHTLNKRKITFTKERLGGGTLTKNALDMIDEKIVELLQENARIAIKEIAAQVFLSSPAVTARIERLESKGIIKGYHAAVDSVNLGYKIKAFVNLDLEPVQKEEFYPFIESVENVIECNCVTGEYSMLSFVNVIFPTKKRAQIT